MSILNEKNQSFELPSNLKVICMQEYKWDADLANKALYGYSQFMKLKLQLKDWDAEILLPPTLVRMVWHQHIFDQLHYYKACSDYAGVLIDNNPNFNFGLDTAVRDQSIKTTKSVLKAVFGDDIDGEVWSFGDDAMAAAVPRPKKRRVELGNFSVTPCDNRFGMSLGLELRTWRTTNNDKPLESYSFKMGKKQSLQHVIEAYARISGVGIVRIRVLYGGHQIDPNKTPLQLGMEPGGMVDVVLGY